MIRAAALLLAATALTCHPAASQSAGPEDLLLVGATLIDGTGGPAQTNSWIHLREGRIHGLGRGRHPSPAGAQVLDLSGRTVTPGLSDMHAHLGAPEDARWMLSLMLLHGVTTVLDPANGIENSRAIRTWAQGQAHVPHLYFATPPIQGSYQEQRFLQPGDEVAALVSEYAAAEVDYLKVYNWLSSAGLVQVGKLGRELGIPVTGHTPLSWTSVGSIDAGITMLQHLRIRPYEVIDDVEIIARYPVDGALMKRTGFWAHFQPDGNNLERTLDAWERRRDRFWVTPTLVVQEAVAESYDHPDPRFEAKPGVEWLRPTVLERFEGGSPPFQWGRLAAEEIEEAKRSTNGMAEFVRLAHERGVRVLSGTDTPIPWLIPGRSLHQELWHFVEKSGMSPEEAIRTSTGEAAAALGLTDRGTVQVGNVADLVVMTGNVAEDVRASESVEYVLIGGTLLSRAQLLERVVYWRDAPP